MDRFYPSIISGEWREGGVCGVMWSGPQGGSVGVVLTTHLNGNPINTDSVPKIEMGRYRRGCLFPPVRWSVGWQVGKWTLLSLVEYHLFLVQVCVDEHVVDREWIFVVENRVSHLVCRVIFWTTVFMCPDIFVSFF